MRAGLTRWWVVVIVIGLSIRAEVALCSTVARGHTAAAKSLHAMFRALPVSMHEATLAYLKPSPENSSNILPASSDKWKSPAAEVSEQQVAGLLIPAHREGLYTRLLVFADTFVHQGVDIYKIENAAVAVGKQVATERRERIVEQVRQVAAAWASRAVNGDGVQVNGQSRRARPRLGLLPARRERWKQLYAVDGSLMPKYAGVEGYKRFSDKYFRGNMGYAFMEISAALGTDKFSALGWGKEFVGKTKEYREVRRRIFKAHGKPRTEMTGPGGYIAYADVDSKGKMDKAFISVSAVLSDAEFAALGWGKAFHGTTQEYGKVWERIFDENGELRASMIGPSGYLAYANAYRLKMDKAFKNVSAVLSDAEFAALGWGKAFHGTTQEYGEVRGRIFDREGRPRAAMTGPSGYITYANKYTAGKMQKAFMTVSAVLSDAEFIQLGWGNQFQGTTQEYDQYRRLLIPQEGEFNLRAMGKAGLDLISWSLVNRTGDSAKEQAAYSKVRQNLRAVLHEDEITHFGWPRANPKR